MIGKDLNIGAKVQGPAMRLGLADGEVGTEQTIAAMAAIVHSTDHSQAVRAIASRIEQMQPARPLQQMRELFAWFKANATFRRDPRGVEVLAHPDEVLAQLAKASPVEIDCKKASVLGAGILRQLGIPPIFVVMGRSKTGPYQHVYWGGLIKGVAFHLDPQEVPMPFMRARGPRERTFTV